MSSPPGQASHAPPTLPDPSFEMENGREYHAYHRGKYMFPCDEGEKDRMDIYHKLFSVASNEVLHFAPIHEVPGDTVRILDWGTGTGIWAIDMATRYPGAQVAGLDLSPIQPHRHPQNLSFHIQDIDGEWDGLGFETWNMIHMRQLNGSIADWPRTYAMAFRHLKPQVGYLEQIEIDLEPRCDDDTIPQFADLKSWYRALDDATTINHRPIKYNPYTGELLTSQGFVDIRHQVIRLPLNPGWTKDSHEKNVARWYNLGFTQGLHALTLAPLRRKSNWSMESVQKLVDDVMKEVCARRIHAYHEM
ncbi:S-adenosyl-L-methionine-dependent methyltransferase [Calycina marina]|uniref:S-adenosyl-L-methionine-dependent methyltransferase n=1 Tax=Calycina marina TaxID=1763456 RepID=A0A9P7Z2X2_9HELO|nr:S-adenosyl-L-methionine-dependent methyltransferase [Calycina marina]